MGSGTVRKSTVPESAALTTLAFHEKVKIMTVAQELRGLLQRRPLQLLVLAGLLTAVAARALFLKFCVLDLDIWWHLKVGDWIIDHHAVPHTGILSRTAADRPWVAYSWGYEVLLSRAYRWFGLVGIGIYGILLTLAVAYSIYWMALRLSGRFWWACALATITCSAFLYNLMPRPVFFSMALFAVTLTLILEATRTGRVQLLYWLPPLFLLWANLHIQFLYGLFLVGLLLGVNLLQRVANHLGITPSFVLPPTLPTAPLAGIFAACVLASCIGPYSYHLYVVIAEYSKAQVPYAMIRELQAINFRAGSHYVQLLLTGAGFFALGWQKKIDPFKLALLIVASVVSYRTMRDSWFICISAAACIADFPVPQIAWRRTETWLEKSGVAVFVAVALVLVARDADFNQRGLDRAISSMYPVKALNYLRQHPAPGPIYNTLDWGGFLTWYMPDYPVAIDGRNDLYGDDMDRLFFETENGGESYATDPYLNEAGVVLLQKSHPLADLLLSDPRFSLVYQDQLAALFVRR
jgi:hypothetical protein